MLEWGLLSEAVQDRLMAVTSLVVQQRLWDGRASPAWHVASVAVLLALENRLRDCGGTGLIAL